MQSLKQEIRDQLNLFKVRHKKEAPQITMDKNSNSKLHKYSMKSKCSQFSLLNISKTFSRKIYNFCGMIKKLRKIL